MSRYDWEQGTIKLPPKEYAKVRDTIIEAFNFLQKKALELADDTYMGLKADVKGKRGINHELLLTSEDGWTLAARQAGARDAAAATRRSIATTPRAARGSVEVTPKSRLARRRAPSVARARRSFRQTEREANAEVSSCPKFSGAS